LSVESSDIPWIAGKVLLKDPVKITYTAIAAFIGDFTDGSACLFQKLLGFKDPDGVYDIRKTAVSMVIQHPAQMNGRNICIPGHGFQREVLCVMLGDIDNGFSVHVVLYNASLDQFAAYGKMAQRVIDQSFVPEGILYF
jgi:hypothetical protein